MDEFLRDIYVAVFRKWVTYAKSDQYVIREVETAEENAVIFDSAQTVGKIVFHDEDVMELSVTNKNTGDIEYYLHFQMQTLKHAVGLFNEMIHTILSYNEQKTLKVLLSCSSGLTTGFFAEELNNGAKTLNKNYYFNAVAYNELADAGRDYDMILLAPQISYQQARVQSIFDHTPVASIPAQVFAKYDVGAVFDLISETLKKSDSAYGDQNMPQLLKVSINHPDQILVIGVINTMHHVHIHYRVYEMQNILTAGDIVKGTIDLNDFNDIIHMAVMKCPQIRHVGIAMPGIIRSGYLTLSSRTIDFDHTDIVGYLKQKYPNLTFSLDNDVNAVAVALYAVQKDIDTLSFLYLPRGSYQGGVGNVFKGQLIKGYHNIAGEVKYLPLSLSDSGENLAKTETGSLEVMAKTIVSVISVLGPDEIAFYCSNVPDVDELHHAIADLIPQEYIPPIKKIGNLKEYILFGEMLMMIMRIDQETK